MKQVTSQNLIPLCVLRILEEYSDAMTPVTQQELGELLQTRYGITCERKALGRTLHRMHEELGIDIRRGSRGFWLERRTFSERELFFLANLILSCRSLGGRDTSSILEKLRALAGLNTGYRLERQIRTRERLCGPAPEKAENPEVLDAVGVICEALNEGRMISYRPGIHGARRAVSPLGLTLRDRSVCLLAMEKGRPRPAEIRLEDMRDVRTEDMREAEILADAS